MPLKDEYIKRSSGILMAVSSLPSPYGIGTLGAAARDFVDFLAAAGQRWWQMLPVGPTAYGDSPYQSPSTFAGNPYFIDLDLLVADGLLEQAEIDALAWGDDASQVDYGRLYGNRYTLLEKATARGWERDAASVDAFLQQNRWVRDYALFMALKRHFDMRCWLDWPEDIRLRQAAAMEKYRTLLAADVRLFTYIQYLFYTQWNALRDYAHEKGVGIIGDMPIYVALDSVDVWAEPHYFQLDEKGFPTAVAGVPPDYFSEDGQLWGNPLYDYAAMQKDGYAWWIRRVDGASKLYDIIRIDHFRGFSAYWSVPYGAATAKGGKWVDGPGMSLVGVLRDWFANVRFIAEDLGAPSPDVVQLLADSGFPGMKVLEFAFDSKESSDYLPHTYPRNCVCYAGTHDNETVAGWLAGADPDDRRKVVDYLGLNDREGAVWGLLRGGMGSVADLFVAQMQDYLELDNTARMNTPGSTAGNWLWRVDAAALTPALAKKIAKLTNLYDR